MSARDTRRRRFRGFKANLWLIRNRSARCLAGITSHLPEDPRAIRLTDRRRQDIYWIVSRNTYPGGKPWRATRFDQEGPTSHFDAPALADVLASLTGSRTASLGPCYAFAGELCFHSAR